jgi:hypothetical protein
MTLDEAIKKVEHYWHIGMEDYFTYDEILELEEMLKELKKSRNAISEICWEQANDTHCQDCVMRKYGVCPDNKADLYGEWERGEDGRE